MRPEDLLRKVNSKKVLTDYDFGVLATLKWILGKDLDPYVWEEQSSDSDSATLTSHIPKESS